ncbi:MAG: hypothetical protein A2496_00285 [Burkholderiales bacterium RIFOXYC12_FULL_60_6]|nr:MAG: hypothetical protein A2496_00285 [Burkholderiales bacterium RIFOXYC12_FULL_60_6]
MAAILLAATLLAGCSDTVAPTPAVQLPAASASDTSAQTTLVGTVPAGPTSEVPATASAAKTDLTKAQESSAMPMPGQANDHSTTSPKATQKATTTTP